MQQKANYLPYESTGYFTKIVTEYLSGASQLKPFYLHSADLDGIKNAIAARRSFHTPREVLTKVLKQQYSDLNIASRCSKNIDALADENTFAITTAHQPNIFTGPLYFIYKIMHTIRLADELNNSVEGCRFVPVYYMGSEDADLDELGFVNVGGQRLTWHTRQTGAVGRMKVDKALLKLINDIHGQAGVLPFGEEWISLLKEAYKEGSTIQEATLRLVNSLFGSYGLVVLIPDNAELKTAFSSIVAKELTEKFSHTIVADTIEQLGAHYKVQAGGRDINLFYLLNDKRERIEPENDKYEVKALGLAFTKEEILSELDRYPDRFSANVILRGAFQETVLPGVVFIGGGGELAYWLELKNVFAAAGIPYPVLMLRNSFLWITAIFEEQWNALGFTDADLFRDKASLLNDYVKRTSANQLSLKAELNTAKEFYNHLKDVTDKVDPTLSQHVGALETQALKKLQELGKKILRAEKRRFETERGRIEKIKDELFPSGSLQERTDNVSLYYSRYGKAWLDLVYECSTPFNDGFTVAHLPA